MLCPLCGRYNDDDKVVCVYDGTLLEQDVQVADGEEELMRFRQGRHLRGKEAPAEEPRRRRRGGASRAFEDPLPPQTPESTGELYGSSESLSSTGHYLGDEEEILMRQVLDDEEFRQAEPSHVVQGQMRARRSRLQRHISYQRAVNWAHVGIAAFVLAIAATLGFLLFLRNTETGQVLVARWGRDASAKAMWQVGGECFDRGEVERAIEYFTAARAKDKESGEPNLTGLLQLGEAYEAMGDLLAAEEVYAYVYTTVDEKSADAYRAQVRVLLELDRGAEAAALLQTAYQKTGQATFRAQRLEILPTVPTVDVSAGYYTQKMTLVLSQTQECSILYTFDPLATLPEDGLEYTGPIELGEGEWELRAVAVEGDLVSDPLRLTYQIYMPTPLQPDANLAPGTYDSARKNVRLWPGSLSDEELEKNPGYAAQKDDPVAQDITIYYTIDGSIPDADSPIYTGEPIVMATNGYNWLRAVSVNGYGKQGNMKEVEIKLNLRTKAQKVYCTEDVIADLKVGTTTQEAFLRQYGEGKGKESVWLYGIDGECVRYTYDWGYVTFMKTKTGWLLAEVWLTSNALSAPRGTAIGMKEAEITAKFRDYGQVTSPSGNRGLYHDVDSSDKGKIYVQEDGGKIIRYRTGTPDMHVWQLDYILNDAGVCTDIHWLYER
ncbi:MAG: chitobiase/beta-hexosaminidase C-terminal domain-containing protein [Clostridia bacterium]|nr:chitobiase/beta-hexosaminidase C-terminal domain-containing protein [Clostridia bacterium]